MHTESENPLWHPFPLVINWAVVRGAYVEWEGFWQYNQKSVFECVCHKLV